jgi:hypothetical protein
VYGDRFIKEDDMSNISIQLKLVKDTGRYLVAEQDGSDFWFDKETLAFWQAEENEVSITLDSKSWTRRLRNAQLNAEPKPETRTRKCLCCGAPFQAEKMIFVCSPCKKTQSWQMGGTVFAS